MKPVYVAPIVAYLCHEDCTDTGGVFEVNSLFLANTLYRPLCCVSDFFFYCSHIPLAIHYTLNLSSIWPFEIKNLWRWIICS